MHSLCVVNMFSPERTLPAYLLLMTTFFLFLIPGLFGTNNVEYADDLRLPNGKISIDVVSFVNSWEVSARSNCQALERGDLLPKCRAQRTQVCRRLFNNRSTSLSR